MGASFLVKSVAVIALLLICSATVAMKNEQRVHSSVDEQPAAPAPKGVRLFDLHDPDLSRVWPEFLAATPMLDNRPVPPPLQNRLRTLVGTYRDLTAVGEPAYFVATYFDLLSEELLAKDVSLERTVLPMQVCPVFASGRDAAVSTLLATVSGLSTDLFLHAPGREERYRYLLLQTEFSHCNFLTTARALAVDVAAHYPDPNIAFHLDSRSLEAIVGSRDELRALVETVGEIEAIRSFRDKWPASGDADEADVLSFLRLLSLLATDSKNGYGAIPVLFPLLAGGGMDAAPTASLAVADALELAYQARAAFRKLVPYRIHDAGDLWRAKLLVRNALTGVAAHSPIDTQITDLLQQFVDGADLLLAAVTPKQKNVADQPF